MNICHSFTLSIFRQDGSAESAAQLLQKAAKIVESSEPEKAIGIYFKAAETIGLEDEPAKAIDHMAKAARLQVSLINLLLLQSRIHLRH